MRKSIRSKKSGGSVLVEPTHIDINGGRLTKQTIILGNHKYQDFISGGAILENCLLDIRGAGVNLYDVTLKRCTIKVRRQMSNKQFTQTRFAGCAFEGKYVGCRFGTWRSAHESTGYYTGCDFSHASLDLCDFYEGEIEAVAWPVWPCFVVLEPWKNRLDWLAISLPPRLSSTQAVVGCEPFVPMTSQESQSLEEQNKECRAVTVDLSRYQDVDPETIWPLIQDKPYIAFTGKEEKHRASRELAARIEKDNAGARIATDARNHHCKIWGILDMGIVERIERGKRDIVSIHVDMSHLKRRLPDAPGHFVLELTGCSKFVHVPGTGRRSAPLTEGGTFRFRSARMDGENVVVSGMGKQGVIQTQYKSWQLLTPNGTEYDVEHLLFLVRQWGLGYDPE